MSTLEAREQRIFRAPPVTDNDSRPRRARHDICEIIDLVCTVSGVARAFLMTPCRGRHVSDVRHLAMFLCKMLTRKPYQKIGQHFDRHHTVIMYAMRKFEPVEILLYERVSKSASTEEWVHAAIKAAREVFPTFGQRGHRW